MAKYVIQNSIGHSEYPEFDIDIYDKQIIIRTKGDRGNWHSNQNRDRDRQRDQPRRDDRKDDGNMSILSSIDRLAEKFGKKK